LIDVGTAVGYLLLDTKGFQSGFSSAMKDMKTFQDESATVSDKFSAMGSALTSVGGTLTKSVTLPLVGLGATVTAVAANFETSMSKVAAIAGLDTTGEEFDALSEKAKEMGATTKFSASEAADAFTYMAMAGWKTESMLDGIDGIMQLAAASGEDLATTSDIVTDALTAFGLQASDSSHFADILAAASNNANTNVSMLGESFKYVAPVAGALGYSAEDTSIALGLMANSGIKASQAGTALRTAMSNLVKPTSEMAMVMDQYGISITDAEGNMKPFMTVMADLREKMGGLDEATQAAAASTLFGKEAMSGMLAIINASDEDFDKLTNSIYNADGTAAQMAETMQDNLTGQLTILKSALEGLAISFGEILIPYLTQAVRWLTGVIDKFNSMDESTKKLIVVVGTIAAAIGPVLLIIGKLSSAIGSIIGLIGGAGGLSAIITALTGPLGIVIAAVAALTTAWVTNFGGIRDATAEIFGAIKSIFTTAWEFISNLWNENFLAIRDIATTVWESIELIFQTAFNLISNAFQIFAALFQGDWDTAWNLVKESVSQIWETIKTLFSNFLNLIVDTLIKIGVRLLQAAKDAFNQVKEGFQNVWEAIKTWFSGAVNDPVGTIEGIGTALFEAGKSIFTSLWDGMKSIWESITSWVSDAVNWVVEKVQFWKDESDKVSGESTTGTVSVDGSYASGLDYVPSDRIVKVHEGEAILTKQENANRTNSSGDTYNFYSPVALTPTKAAQEFKRAKQELALGFV
jgi:TP901 family phage tail tape measure protein